MAFTIRTETRNKRTIYHLEDKDSDSSASILPSYGFNLFDLRLPVTGTPRRVIVAADDWADNPRSAGRNGIPVLFPYPNRVRGGKFTFEGKTYDLPINNGPNAIHGFAIEAPWDVVDQGASDKSAFLTGRFRISQNAPDMLKHWPTDATLEIKYTLSPGRLSLDATVSNPTAHILPFGFGIHPYFKLPLDPKHDLAKCNVVIPASEYWVLNQFLPTGEHKPVDERLDFRHGQSLKGLKLDDVLTGLRFGDDRCACRLSDFPGGNIGLSFDRGFRELVVYTPPDAPGLISLEPYTQTTDAINLQARGVDAGLRVLKHGEHAELSIVIETTG
ncbi:MAG TPA: aldose 1-epimerase [Isosphaeraceae bacterium]|jgi:aldose 1-epimerase|nr:aldose 1-epimerase [Isosphaeraceae bacterium]